MAFPLCPDVLWSFVTAPHPEPPGSPRISSPCWVVALSLLSVPSLLQIPPGRGTAVLALQPPAPHGGSGNRLSPPCGRGKDVGNLWLCPAALFGEAGVGSHDFIPGTPLPGRGGGCRSLPLLPLFFLHPFIPPHAPLSPPTLAVGAPGHLGCCPAHSSQPHTNLGSVPAAPEAPPGLFPHGGREPENFSVATLWLQEPPLCRALQQRFRAAPAAAAFSPCNLLVEFLAPLAGTGELSLVPGRVGATGTSGKGSGEARGCRTGHPPCRASQGNRPFVRSSLCQAGAGPAWGAGTSPGWRRGPECEGPVWRG